MILNCGGSATFLSNWRRNSMRSICLAAGHVNSEQLRAQLDQLHSEAEHTRLKASNARLRLMRLSETAEKLRRQAAINVQNGRENDARDLLFQKKKVMQALEKSKTRITLLDELASKLNEAISMKETDLIENVSSDINTSREDDVTTVRIVSPKDDDTGNINGNADLTNQGLEVHAQAEEDKAVHSSEQTLPGSFVGDTQNETDSLEGTSSYEEFMAHVDQHLNQVEAELATILRVSRFILEGEENTVNAKVQQTAEVLEGVRNIRKRISSILQKKVEIR